MTTTNSEQIGTNVNENVESTNILSNREPSDFQPTTPINTVVDNSLNLTPPPIDTVSDEKTAKIQTPPISTTAVEKPLNFTPPPIGKIPVETTEKIQTSPISTTAVEKPLNFTPPPIGKIPVETTEKIQTSPISTTAVEKPLNFTPPPTDTIAVERSAKLQTPSISITAVEKTSNSQSTPVEAVTVDNTTSAKPGDTTLVIDDPKTSVKVEIKDKTGKGDAAGEGACIACLCGTCLMCLCGSGCLVFCLGITAIIPLLQLIFGLKYSDECPVSRRIPQYLIVAGAIGLIVIGLPIIKIIVGMCGLWTSGAGASTVKYIVRTISYATHILNAFLFCWFIAGCVWIFGAYGKVQYKFHDQINYCNSTLYRFAFWLLILSTIGNVISFYSAYKNHKPSKNNVAFTRVPTAEP